MALEGENLKEKLESGQMELFEAVRKTKYTRIPETANTLHRLQTKLSDKNRDFCLISVNLLTEVGDCIVVKKDDEMRY